MNIRHGTSIKNFPSRTYAFWLDSLYMSITLHTLYVSPSSLGSDILIPTRTSQAFLIALTSAVDNSNRIHRTIRPPLQGPFYVHACPCGIPDLDSRLIDGIPLGERLMLHMRNAMMSVTKIRQDIKEKLLINRGSKSARFAVGFRIRRIKSRVVKITDTGC